MFDLGWSELAVVAVVALVIIGPKDLPRVLRTIGQWVARARTVARDFQSSVDEMAREADLQDVKKHIDDLRTTNVSSLIEKHLDPKGELREALEPPKELSHDPFADDPAHPATPASDASIRHPVDYLPPPESGGEAPVPDDTPAGAVPDVPPPVAPVADTPAPAPSEAVEPPATKPPAASA
ncbi:hypothetical protein STAQ_34130 [Allostella sp. ATCC 35155]|nr:hypothetical protein STAQ_34130 [Stella sp. ATCC 35155]